VNRRQQDRRAAWFPIWAGIVPALSILLLAMHAPPATAQEPEAETTPPIDTEQAQRDDDLDLARRKLELLDGVRADVERIFEQQMSATGDEFDLLRIEGIGVVENMRNLTAEIVKIVAGLDAPPEAIDPLRRATADHLSYQGDLVFRDQRFKDRLFAEMRRRRSSVPVGELESSRTVSTKSERCSISPSESAPRCWGTSKHWTSRPPIYENRSKLRRSSARRPCRRASSWRSPRVTV